VDFQKVSEKEQGATPSMSSRPANVDSRKTTAAPNRPSCECSACSTDPTRRTVWPREFDQGFAIDLTIYE